MKTNQKGFVNIILTVLVIVLAGVVGYFVLVKKPAPIDNLQSNNLQNTRDTIPLPANNVTSQNQPPTNSDKELSGLMSITLPSYCSFTLDASASSSLSGEKVWIIDCGRTTKNNARGFMGKILGSQGWKFCNSQTATADWWKDGVITGVMESENSGSASSYTFHISQSKGAECQSQ